MHGGKRYRLERESRDVSGALHTPSRQSRPGKAATVTQDYTGHLFTYQATECLDDGDVLTGPDGSKVHLGELVNSPAHTLHTRKARFIPAT